MASTTPILSPKRARVLTLKQEIAILEMSKKVLQTIYLHPRNGQCPYGNNTFQKGTSLTHQMRTTFDNLGGSEVRKRKEHLL